MMKLITLFLYFATSGSTYTIDKLPLILGPEMTCFTALDNNTIIKQLPDGVKYKGKQVFMYYCKNSLTGKFIN
ncbi:hypothetical protein [uncultured Mediterranean phage]|nr:hypothetical protein [uncultured Mediterranean phage]